LGRTPQKRRCLASFLLGSDGTGSEPVPLLACTLFHFRNKTPPSAANRSGPAITATSHVAGGTGATSQTSPHAAETPSRYGCAPDPYPGAQRISEAAARPHLAISQRKPRGHPPSLRRQLTSPQFAVLPCGDGGSKTDARWLTSRASTRAAARPGASSAMSRANSGAL